MHFLCASLAQVWIYVYVYYYIYVCQENVYDKDTQESI